MCARVSIGSEEVFPRLLLAEESRAPNDSQDHQNQEDEEPDRDGLVGVRPKPGESLVDVLWGGGGGGAARGREEGGENCIISRLFLHWKYSQISQICYFVLNSVQKYFVPRRIRQGTKQFSSK